LWEIGFWCVWEVTVMFSVTTWKFPKDRFHSGGKILISWRKQRDWPACRFSTLSTKWEVTPVFRKLPGCYAEPPEWNDVCVRVQSIGKSIHVSDRWII
jgi:hypothetical protein